MSNQEEAMQRDGRNVSPNFLSWFRDYVKISYNITLLSYVCILNILITSFFQQCVKVADVHPVLRQLAYRLVKVKSYGRYDVNGF
jgi:hypothetical protein